MSERIDLNNFKVITDKLNTYFKNNQFMVGSSIPNVGTYKVGDIIINNGNNATEIPMWICTEAGTPGTWEVFNSGGMEETELENYITNIVQSQAISAVDYTDGMDIQIDGKDYSSDIGQLNDLCTTNKDNLVGAINELFQNANNGKELIANAIGEPLNSEDTFNAMSTDINSLLSTFKANMMNAGVVVESGDKFKSLIEKIKGLTEGEGNKDLQCATGTCKLTTRLVANYSGTRTVSKNILSTNDIGFVPTYLFMKLPGCQFRYNPSNITTVYTLATWIKVNDRIKGEGGYIEVNYTTEEGAIIKVVSSSSGYEITLQGGTIEWYAIGVGEEDTTLRDSLANILGDKGIDVTEEDDMASLITKVDSISGGGLDIISATELPATGKENQICVITDNPVDNFMLTSNYNDKSTDNNIITFYTGNTINTDINDGTLLQISKGNLITNYYFNKSMQGVNRLASYYYRNNTWNNLTLAYIPLLEKGTLSRGGSYEGSFKTGTGASYTTGSGLYLTTANYTYSSYTVPINFLLYNEVRLTVQPHDKQSTYISLYNCISPYYNAGTSGPSSNVYSNVTGKTLVSSGPITISFDISTWTAQGYLTICKNTLNSGAHITDIYLL